MSLTLEEQGRQTAEASKTGLPPFRPLAIIAFSANVPILSWMLLTGRLGNSLSTLAGFLIGIALYGSLHLFIGRGLEPFFASVRGQAKPVVGGTKTLFIALLPLKYLVIGGLMFLLIRGGHLSIVWFIVGFLITQISITVATVSRLAKHRA
ncbi:MAG: hypothetical protein ACRYFS_19250 [Janthinobacterium lividum]